VALILQGRLEAKRVQVDPQHPWGLMRRAQRLFLLLLVFVGLVLGWTYWELQRFLEAPLSPQGGYVELKIPPGSSFHQNVQLLKEAGIISQPLLFEYYGRFQGAASQIKAGRYRIDLSIKPPALLKLLERGAHPPQIRLTLPEGFNRWQIADRLSAQGLVKRAAFLEQVKRDDLEGRLFPDTYLLPKKISQAALIQRLLHRHEQIFGQLLKDCKGFYCPQDAKARRKLLILASLIEEEARTERDRGLVSRVFYNRLALGMKLQTDPTCVYGEALYKKRPHPKYCRDKQSVYSTYIISELPPGPISNPGRAALRAALYPAEGAKLLFFVARQDGSGEHHFSETYTEHKRALKRALKGR